MADEAAGLADHAGPVAAQYQAAVETFPEIGEAADGFAKVQGTAGQGHGVDGPGRGADNDRERVGGAQWQQIGDAGQYPHLISRARTTAGEDQAGDGVGCGHFGPL
ncbi:hypothetical protein D3C84_407570 [compost metagenome]